jgi:8-oxo-dGTP pyrophosphatase MutT (NUDIX family)
MRIVEKITDNRFINLKEVVDPDKNVKGYQFAERLGRDSVAFICYDEDSGSFLVNEEYKPPVDSYVVGAFGGSMDKDKSPDEIVLAEVKEEAGYEVSKDDIRYVGKSFVSTQMNQYCYLYIVFVDRNDKQEREPENAVEAMSKTHWISRDSIYGLDDWKAITILAKAIRQDILE